MVLTHISVSRRFSVRFDPDVRREVMAFGWPLMVNSFFIFAVMNGDRVIVSNQFGLIALGWFSAAAMMAFTPINFIMKTLQAVLLPPMARFQDDTPRLQRQYEMTGGVTVMAGTAMVIGVALFGQWAMVLVFGAKYAMAAPYLLLLMIGQAFRLSRVPASMAAMARAETRNMLYANIVRAIFIPVAFLVALQTGAIVMMMVAGIIGELVATLATGHLIEQRVRLRADHLYRTVLLQAAICASTVLAIVYPLAWLATVALTAWLLYQQRAVLMLVQDLIRTRRH